MNGLQYMEALKATREDIDAKLTIHWDRIENLRSQAMGGSQNLTGMPHAPSGDQDRMGTAIAELVDLEDSTMGYIAELETDRDETVHTMIRFLNQNIEEEKTRFQMIDHFLFGKPIYNRRLYDTGCLILENIEV